MISRRRVGATFHEHSLVLPGDELISDAADTLTHGITIESSPKEMWPWLAQMGADRAGWYSYDWLDNGRRPSATRIVSELQYPRVGAVFPALPGVKEGFILVEKETNHWLVLGWPAECGGYAVTWAFVLREIVPNVSRLIVRVRASQRYSFYGLPRAMGLWVAKLVHFIMQRKQLIGIATRAERLAS